MVYGDRRPYLVALIVVDPEISKNISEEELNSEVSNAVKKANENLSQIEKIKKYIIIDEPLSTDNGIFKVSPELTTDCNIYPGILKSN